MVNRRHHRYQVGSNQYKQRLATPRHDSDPPAPTISITVLDAPTKRFGPEHIGDIVSSGTLLNRDLVPSFIDYLGLVDPELAAARKREYESLVHDPYDADYGEQAEQVTELLVQVMDDIDAALPADCYFGSAEGDGACFGVWPVDD